MEEVLKNYIDNLTTSDFYFASGSLPAVRIDNEIIFVGDIIVQDQDIEVFVKNYISLQKIPYDFGITFLNRRLRCNLDKRWQGYDLTIRILPSHIKTLDELGLPSKLYSVMDNKHGFILVCGPTGSGKSTTLASLIDYVNQKYSKKIILLEDPIEYIIKEKKSIICQREVDGNSNDGFLSGLKFAMRQRPDIIVVGEIREVNTAKVALQAAETGHLVLSTLHTYSVEQTLTRFIDMFPDEAKSDIRSSLASVLRAIIVQKLIKGKYGIKPAYEICIVTKPISQAIRAGKFQQIKNLMITSVNEGNIIFEESLKRLIEMGHIAYEEAEKYMEDKNVF